MCEFEKNTVCIPSQKNYMTENFSKKFWMNDICNTNYARNLEF